MKLLSATWFAWKEQGFYEFPGHKITSKYLHILLTTKLLIPKLFKYIKPTKNSQQ